MPAITTTDGDNEDVPNVDDQRIHGIHMLKQMTRTDGHVVTSQVMLKCWEAQETDDPRVHDNETDPKSRRLEQSKWKQPRCTMKLFFVNQPLRVERRDDVFCFQQHCQSVIARQKPLSQNLKATCIES